MAALKDQAEALIRLVGEDGISKLADTVNAKMGALVDRQKESTAALDEQKKSVLTLSERWAVMTSGVGAALGIMSALKGAVSAVATAVTEAAQQQSVAAEFGRGFGTAAEKMEQLRAASRGLLDDAAIARIGAQANRAGLDINQASQLLEASTRAAVGSGRDVVEVSDLVLKSVVEQNDEAAKQLGIHVDLKASAEAYAKSIGMSVDHLSAAQRVASALKETTGAIGSAFGEITGEEQSAKLAKLESKWNNLSAVIKGFIADRALAVADAVTGESAAAQSRAGAERNASAMVDAIVRGKQTLLDRMSEFKSDAEMVDFAGFTFIDSLHQNDALGALQAQLDKTGQKLNAVDVILQNLNWDPARIEQAQREFRALGDAVGAIKLGEAATQAAWYRAKAEEDTAAAVELFVKWSGGISGVFAEQRDRTMDLLQARLEQGRSSERASEATLADLVAQAKLADQLQLSTEATRIWDEASKLASGGQIDLSKNIVALELALRGSNNEAAKAALLQAQLATAFFNTAAAAAAQKRAADILAHEHDKKPGSGGGARKPRLTYELKPETEKSVSELAAKANAIRDQVASMAEDRANKELQARQASWIADAQAEVDRQAAQRQALIAAQTEGFQSAAASADAFSTSLQNLSGIDLGPLGASVTALDPLVSKIQEMANATDLSHESMVSGVTGIVAGAGKITAGLIKNETARAAVMALVETAEGIGALAIGNYGSAGLHFASAAIYGTVAGMSAGGGSKGRGGSSSGSRSGPDVPRVSSTATNGAAAPAPISYTIYMAGATVIGADDQQVGRHMTRVLDEHAARSAGSRNAGPR